VSGSVTQGYILGRKTWQRPQAMIWGDAEPTISSGGMLIPTGYEVGANTTGLTVTDQFLIISDHNRGNLEVANNRIEQRQRMANGTMRSYFIADKLTISTSWNMLPSRGFAVYPDFDQEFGDPDIPQQSDNYDPTNTEFKMKKPPVYFANKSEQYTVDGGAGGGELLDWYESHTGPFWVLLSYDKYNEFGTDDAARKHLGEYSQAVQMYISSFNYSVVKRGSDNFDLWNVSVTLEEV
jgi:hypothetical protein